MSKNKAISVIKKHIGKNNLKIKKIILFGSRARGDFNKDSDWDFLVIIDKELSFRDKNKIFVSIKRDLAKLKIPTDIIIKSENSFNESKNSTGNISNFAKKEGVIVE